jgi:restriction system protein
MSNQIKKSNKNDNMLAAWIKDMNFFFRVKLRFNALQSYGFIFSVFMLPISFLFGFTDSKMLAFQIIFVVSAALFLFLVFYTIKNLDRIRKSQKNVLDISSINTIEEIDHLSGEEFERFVQMMFKDWGFFVDPTQATHDQGGDLIVEKGRISYVVEVKKRSKTRINAEILNKLVTYSLKYYKTNKAWLVTSNYLNSDATNYYKENKDILNVTDRKDIREYLSRKRNRAKTR